MCQLGRWIADWLFPLEPEEPAPTPGTEVQLQIQGSQIQLTMGLTAIRNGRQLAITTGNARNAVPAEAPRQEGVELTPQAVERWHEERWVQRGAEANMTLEEFIRWRRQEERLIHGEDLDSGEDSASAEEESSGGAGCPAGAGRPARAV